MRCGLARRLKSADPPLHLPVLPLHPHANVLAQGPAGHHATAQGDGAEYLVLGILSPHGSRQARDTRALVGGGEHRRRCAGKYELARVGAHREQVLDCAVHHRGTARHHDVACGKDLGLQGARRDVGMAHKLAALVKDDRLGDLALKLPGNGGHVTDERQLVAGLYDHAEGRRRVIGAEHERDAVARRIEHGGPRPRWASSVPSTRSFTTS